jgi:hypothetical protein
VERSPMKKLEGWYTDPYARHEARWLSDGRPTKLVRDGDVTSYEDPPDGAFTREPEPIVFHPTRGNADDLRRADDADRGPADLDPNEVYMRAMDVLFSDGAPMDVMWPDDAQIDHGDQGAADR